MSHDLPQTAGLYRPEFEHDACGVSFVVDLHGRRSHDLVAKGLTSLCNLEHRGATGAEQNTGDGAGILIQVPDAFLRAVLDVELPAAGRYAVGNLFLPGDVAAADAAAASIDKICAEEGLEVLAWREVPIDPSMIGATALEVMPTFRQLVIASTERRRGRDRAGPQGLPGAQAHGARDPRRRRRGVRLRALAVVPHDGLQGHAHHAAAR